MGYISILPSFNRTNLSVEKGRNLGIEFHPLSPLQIFLKDMKEKNKKIDMLFCNIYEGMLKLVAICREGL